MLECHNHGAVKNDPKHVFSFKAFIADDTAQIPVTVFSPVADALINMDCNKMVIELGYTDPHTIPEPILELKGTKKVFQFHFNQKSPAGKVDFVMDKIMEITYENQVQKEAIQIPSTPPDENQQLETHQVNVSPSMLNKRKSSSVDKDASTNLRKQVKRELFQEEADEAEDKQTLESGGKTSNKGKS